jgi:hypothetical protein
MLLEVKRPNEKIPSCRINATITPTCAPNLALISEISEPLAQCKLMAPPVAPAATPHIALHIVPTEIIGRKNTLGT